MNGRQLNESALTQRQRMILETIRDTARRRGYPPSMREIADAVGLSSTSSVNNQMKNLRRLGYIRAVPGKPRAIEIIDPDGLDPQDAELQRMRARERRVRDLAHDWGTRGHTVGHLERAAELKRVLDSDGHPPVMSSADEARSYELICQAAQQWKDGDLTAEQAMQAVCEQVGV